MLHGDRRCTTLTGTAGMGKTTLALEVARAVEPVMPDGAWLVDLTVVREPDAIPRAMVAALGLVDQARAPLEALADHVAARQALLVLENCEHLLPSLAAVVNTLLDRAPDLRILATSRAPLNVRDESLFQVRPFEVPPAGLEDLGRLASFDAVRLFAERASAVDPGFSLTAATAPAVASICRRVDGIPLAIGLAAASASTLTAVEIDERLAATGTLGDGKRGTMAAALDWSHDLLGPEARVAFRRLAVFAGPFSLEAAEQVGSLGTDPASVLPHLAELVSHSLVMREGDGARSRYRMLAPIAEYAALRLAASDELGPAAMTHATYFLQRSMSPYANLGECLPGDIDLLADLHQNCLAALRFATQAGIVPIRLGLALNLVLLWRVRGHLHLALDVLEGALAVTADGSYEQGVVHGVLAEFLTALGTYDAAEDHARRAEATFTPMGDARAIRTVIAMQGLAAAGRGEIETALRQYERARPFIESSPNDLSWAYWEAGVGRFELERDNLEAAQAHLEEADRRFRLVPSWFHGRALAMLGDVARRRGDPARAASLLGEGLRSLCAYGATLEAISCLEDMARLAIDERANHRAATLLAASIGLRDATAAVAWAADAKRRNADIDRLRAALPRDEFETAWAAGIGMTLEWAMSFATAAPAPAVAGRQLRGSVLTPREREIAELVALGLSNREIADRLVIAPGTVKIHVERILGKLGRTSRVQVATWVHEERASASAPQGMPGGR